MVPVFRVSKFLGSDGSEVSRFQPDKSDAVSKPDTVLEFWSED